MGYQRALVTRWSRRDKLAILVIAVTVAFLTGTTLIVAAVSTQTTTIAEEYGTHGTAVHYDSVTQARQAAGENAFVIPLATVELPNGATRYVAGISDRQATAFQAQSNLSLPPPPENGVTSGVQTTTRQMRFVGHRRTLTVHVTPRTASRGLLPADWYVAHPQTVQQLGPSGAYVITPSHGAGTRIPSHGVTLQSVLAFFVVGTRQLLTVLSLTAVGGMVLVGVTVFSVMRMTVRDRRQSIRVLRSTGCRPRTVVGLFALRAGLLTAVGVGLGYAIGIILPHIVVNTAISAGLPTSLSVQLSRFVLAVLLPMYGGAILISLLAGGMAAWPTMKTPPARVTAALDRNRRSPQSSRNRLYELFSLRLLDWRALGPSTATLTVFVTVVLLVTSLAGVMTPLMSTSGTTITQPGATHPVASTVPAQYADVLRARGIPASAEILLFTVHDGQPIIARGVNYSAFATVSNATLERGHRPRSPNEATIGVDLARTENIDIGDTISLGGSTTPGLARVRIVGTYTAPGLYDDQLLVSLPVARGLSTKTAGTVHIVRTPKQFERETTSSVELLDISAPKQVATNSSLPVEIQLKNFATHPVTHNVTVRFDSTTKTVPVHLNASSQRSVTVHLPTGQSGHDTLRVGSQSQTVTVVSPKSIRIVGLPATAPPNSTPRITVARMVGTPVANASVRVGDTTVQTDANGTARVPLGAAGTTSVHVTAHGRTVTKTVRVSESARRRLVADMAIRPTAPSVLSSTRVRVHLYNPWNTTLDRRLQLSGDGDGGQRHVSVGPGAATVETIRMGRQAPGSHTLRLVSDGSRLTSTSYTVRGDERLVAAYANNAHGGGGSGIGQALSTAFGNFQLLLVVLVLLAGLMTVGSTTAVFAQATHACQRTIGVYRATGAWPARVLRLVVLDALTIGLVSVTGALLLGTGTLLVLDRLNYLVIYGVRISPTLSPGVVLGSVLGGITIMVVSATLVAGLFSRRAPATLVRNNGGPNEMNRVLKKRGSDE